MIRRNFYRALTDEELFAMIKADKKAEAEFYRRYKFKVKAILKNYKLNTLEREDLIQEGMIGLFQAIATYDPAKGAQFSTYSGVVIRNRILNALNDLWKHKKKIDEQKDVDDLVARDNPETDTIKTEQVQSFEKALKLFDGIERKVLAGYLNNRSYRDIAQDLAITTKKVDNILMKIKAKLTALVRDPQPPRRHPGRRSKESRR